MTLEKIQTDMITAWKGGDMLRKGVLATLVDAIKKSAIDKGCRDNITEDIVNAAILKEQKTLAETIEACTADYAKLKAELEQKYAIVSEYAPKMITDEGEIRIIIANSGIELVKKNRGAIMKYLKEKDCDMKTANPIVGAMLV